MHRRNHTIARVLKGTPNYCDHIYKHRKGRKPLSSIEFTITNLPNGFYICSKCGQTFKLL